MKQLLAAAVSLFAAIVGSPALGQSSASIYGALPLVSEAQISPDGSTVAMLQTIGETTAVLFYDLSNPGAQPVGVGVGETKARGISWADNDHLLLLASQASRVTTNKGLKTIEFWRWLSISKSKRKPVVLLKNEPGLFLSSSGQLMSVLPQDDTHALFARLTSRTAGDGFYYALMKVNLDSGSSARLSGASERTDQWVVDQNGAPAARIDFDATGRELDLFARDDSGDFKKVKSYPLALDGRTIGFVGKLAGRSGLAATSYLGGDKRVVVEVDRRSGSADTLVYSNANYDVEDVSYDPVSATATGVTFIDDLPRSVHFDPVLQKVQDSLVKALPGAAPMIVSKTADGQKMIVRAIYSDHPDQYFLFDRGAKSLNQIASTYAALDGKVSVQKEKFDYVGPDGVKIPGYLTVGKGASKTGMPLIVLPHGGPAGRDDMGFDWWSFFYAANGYLVYQPNFRGSEGYGYAFKSAGYGEWGRKMQDDITNGVKKLIEGGVVDPSRICIVGASYGGYAALAGATLTPDLYACAVSVNGVTNLPGMIGRDASDSNLAEDYWDVRIGSRFRDAKELNEVSPAKNAEKAGAPILLIHGRDDTVVPFGQSVEMRNALKGAGKPHEFIELKGEDHWLSRPTSRTEMLEKSLAFINKHIGAK